MQLKSANFTAAAAAIGLGAAAGSVVVVLTSGVMAPVWSFFMSGLVQHFLSMQWARFSCF